MTSHDGLVNLGKERFCSSCSVKTLENFKVERNRKRDSSYVPKPVRSSSSLAFQCKSCNAYHCISCLRKLSKKIKSSKKKLMHHDFFEFIDSISPDGRSLSPIPTLHCCLAQELELPPSKPLTVVGDLNSQYLAGMLWLPTYDLLLKTSFETMTVHCLGEERLNNEVLSPKIPHCVLPHETFAPVKGNFDCNPIQELEFDVELPHCLNGETTSAKIKVYGIERSSFVYDHASRAGTNLPTAKELASCQIFDCETLPNPFTEAEKKDHECISILVGIDGSTVVNCLQMTFHNRNPSSFFEKESPTAFYHNLMKQIGDCSSQEEKAPKKKKARKKKKAPKFYEIHRFGGSSGIATHDDLPKFIGSLPRRLRSALLIPSKDRKCWHYFYISEDGECVSHEYGVPVPGGKFQTSCQKRNGLPTEKLFRNFPVMQHFVFVKALSGLVLDYINDNKCCPWKISPLAALAEKHHVVICRKDLSRFKDEKRKVLLFEWSILYSDRYNRNTLVCHPCGFHYDTFSHQKRASIENKMCFIIPGYGGTGETGIPGCTGRGGSENPTDFVFALLDWESQKSQFRATWAEEIYSLREDAAGEPPRLTRQRRIEIYLENPEFQNRLPNPYEAWNS